MSEKILEQYGRVTIYTEPNHPSPIYHVDGTIEPNPYGDLAVLLEDDNLEEVMYNGGTQCVKVAHRNHGMCRTNVWIDDDSGIQRPPHQIEILEAQATDFQYRVGGFFQ